MRIRHFPAAAIVLLLASAATVHAAPTYSVRNCAQPSPTPQSTPQYIKDTCISSKVTTQSSARADAGSVGASALTEHTYPDDTDGQGGAGAAFYTDEIVVSKLPSAGTLADLVWVAMRFDVHGTLDVQDYGQASAQIIGTLGTISGNTSFGHNNGTVTKEIYGYTVIEDHSAGEVIDMVLETGKISVYVDSPIAAALSISVATFVRQLNEASSDFSNSANFAIGQDVFAFYDAAGNPVTGYTANAGNYIVNNRFGETDGTVPEPGTLALLGLGLAGFAASRRRRH